jgi:hypothetical protein
MFFEFDSNILSLKPDILGDLPQILTSIRRLPPQFSFSTEILLQCNSEFISAPELSFLFAGHFFETMGRRKRSRSTTRTMSALYAAKRIQYL